MSGCPNIRFEVVPYPASGSFFLWLSSTFFGASWNALTLAVFPFPVTHRPELMVPQVRGKNHPMVSLKHEPNGTVSAHISDSDLKMLSFKS